MIIPELAHKSEDLMHRVAFYLETFDLVEQDPELYDAMMEILHFLDEINAAISLSVENATGMKREEIV
jgi:hypothetical protein